MISEKFSAAVAHFCLFFEVILLVAVIIMVKNGDTRLRINDTTNNEIEWCIAGKPVSFPYSFGAKEGVPLELTGTLPDKIPDDCCIEFLSIYSKCEVFVGDECINSYATELTSRYGRLSGNIRVITRIDSKYSGLPVKVVFTPYYSVHADISAISYGDVGNIISSVMAQNVVRFAIIVLLCTIVLIGTGLAIYQKCANREDDTGFFAEFSFFALIVMCWMFLSSDIPQFLIARNTAVSLGSYLCLATVTIPYYGFCSKILIRGRTVCKRMKLMGWMLPALNVIGYSAGLFDPIEILLLSHIYIIIAVAITSVLAVINFKQNLETKLLLMAIVVFDIAAVGGIVLFAIAPSQGFAADLVGLCMVVFIIILFMLVLYRQASYIRDRKYHDAYEELAYTDILTGLKSRKSFEKHFEYITKEIQPGTEIGLILYRINNLKRINDEAGFATGDRAIKSVADCIEKSVKGQGELFRIGGAEFAVVAIAPKRPVEKILQDIDDNLAYLNRFGKLEISAFGGWSQIPLEKKNSFLQDIYRYADQSMYAAKQRVLKNTRRS